MKLVVSLHDVTPFHLKRLVRAEALCRDLGVRKLTYLLVPRYHGGFACAEDGDFVAWCRAAREFAVSWHLHGYQHLEDAATGPAGAWSVGLKRRMLTAGEGEFQALDMASQRRRLEAGRDVFRRCLGREPKGFVAPAWLFNASLPPLLRELGFRYTEDHWRIYELDRDRSVRSPVVTWATRTAWRKYGSLAIGSLLPLLWRREPVLRVAIHPFDFDHRQTIDGIRKVLGRLLNHREQCFCEEIDFAAGNRPHPLSH